MIELEADKDYEWVKCPDCGHRWQQNVSGSMFWMDKGAIRCPKCGHHLKLPELRKTIYSKKLNQ